MATNGAVAIQGCAYRITRLNADGSTAIGSTAMVQDDRSFVKLEAKPVMADGVEITPISACGVPVISYKDCDRYKRWEINLTLGDWDPEQNELVAQGEILTATGSTGRTFADGVLAFESNVITSPADADFLTTDVGRAVTGTGVGTGAYVSEYVSTQEVRVSVVSSTSATGVSVTLGAQPVGTIGYQFPHLLLVACPYGVSIEVWSKLIVRGTGYQGTTPYPSAGTPTIPGSAYLRTGIFRSYLWWDGWTIENKEQTPMFRGWAIENPNFGTGPLDDWRSSGLPATGVPLDTTAWADQMADFQLPTPTEAGFQTLPVA